MTKSQRFDLDLDEPLAFVHKSSIAIAKNRLNQGRQHSAEVAIQTEREVSVHHDFFVTKTSFLQNHLISQGGRGEQLGNQRRVARKPEV